MSTVHDGSFVHDRDGDHRTEKERTPFGLSAFVLKIIACVSMAIDHVGAYIFTDAEALRIIGRVAFPLFAFFIAEGCRYTRNKKKRFFMVFGLAVLCEIGYFLLAHEITGTVLMTFSCSILIIYAWQAFKKALAQKSVSAMAMSSVALCTTVALGYLTSELLPIDYGFPGVLLPVLVSLFDYRAGEAPRVFRALDRPPVRLALFAVGIIAVWYFRGQADVQIYGLLAVIPMAFYNGKPGRGSRRFKYWFYLFYPAHLAVIAAIGMLIDHFR